MATWNMFSPEVAEERRTGRAYGVDKIENRLRTGDSYKAQALRELAKRLELEERVKSLTSENMQLIDRVELLETEIDIAQLRAAPLCETVQRSEG